MHPLAMLLPLALGLSWIRLIRPGLNRLQGTTILTFPLPLLARIRMHALPAGVTFLLTLALAIVDAIPWWCLALPVVSFLLQIALPVRYVLTDIGIRLGWTRFRRWTEFAGVRRAPGGARLVGGHKSRGMHVWLSRSRGDDEFLQFLRLTLRNAYRGGASVVPFPGSPATPPVTDAEWLQDPVSAFTAEG